MDYKKAFDEATKRIKMVSHILKGIDESLKLYTDEDGNWLNDPPFRDVTWEKELDKLMDQLLPLKNRLIPERWYKHKGMLDLPIEKSIVAFYQGVGVQTYGQWADKGWLIKATVNWSDGSGWAPATDEEIKDVLTAEAFRRYSDKRIKFNDSEELAFNDITSFDFITVRNSLCVAWGSENKVMDLFYDGVWAEISERKKATIFGIQNYSEQELSGFIDQIADELSKRRKDGK